MPAHARDLARAFGTLDRRLAERRFAALGARGRVMLALLASNMAAFAYWQSHRPLFALLRHSRGPIAGTLAMAGALAALALLAGALTAWRRTVLAAEPPGPEWLALPAPPRLVHAHLRTEATWVGALAIPPALGLLLAGLWQLPIASTALLAAGFVPAWLLATRAGAAFAWRRKLPPLVAYRRLPEATRALLTAARVEHADARPPARWRHEPAWRAIARLDALVSWRGAAGRARLASVALALVLGGIAWGLPAGPLTRRALAFAAFLPACAMLGAWAVVRTSDPAEDTLRPLPVALRDVWRARATFMAAVVLGSALLNALLAYGFGPLARTGLVLAWAPAGFAIALLGLHYALTLGRRPTLAEGLYAGWLSMALIASLMIPLLGWFVLLAGLIHSSRRLSRWWTPDPETA